MAPFERSKQQIICMRSITLACTLGLLVLVGWLLVTASQLSGAVDTPTLRAVSIGPLNVIQLEKVPLPQGGFSVAMQLLPGMLLYFVLVMAIGAAGAAWRIRAHRHAQVIQAP